MKDRSILVGSPAAGLLAAACWVGPLIPGAMAPDRAMAMASGPSVRTGNPTSGLAGQWRGHLTVNEEDGTTELIVDLDRIAGRWTGQFDLPAFGVMDYPLDVRFSGRRVTLVLSGAQIEFIGALDPATAALTGMAETRGHRDSLVLRRVGAPRLSLEFLRLEAWSGDSTRVEPLSASGGELRTRFNQDRAYTRLLMLLSPT